MHDLGIVGQYADRLAVIVAGELVATGSSREVLTEAAIATYYGASVRLIEGEDGGVVVVPIRHRPHLADPRPTS
jgi:iron complex transport system ATP-binding protein